MGATEASHRIDFEPLGRHGACRGDSSLYELSRELGIDLVSLCGGHGHCGRCRVRLVDGAASEVTGAEREQLAPEELADGFRLACQARPAADCTVYVPPESLSSAMRSQIEGRETTAAPAPLVRAVELELAPPSLEQPLADADAVLAALREAGVAAETLDVDVLRGLSPALRAWGWRCAAHVRGGEVVAVAPPGSPALGLAFDLGTTGVAGYLVELGSGAVLAARGTMNPQIPFGEDVISRIGHARTSAAAREELRRAAVDGLARLGGELCAEAGVALADVAEAVVVGNTAMHHLLLGLPTDQLALAPFVPAVGDAVDVKARDAGLPLAPGAVVHALPNVAAFVGADHVSMLLATEEEWAGRTALVLDIGTNTEISLVTADGAMRSLSAPSGPAFEGYHIRDGMRATDGAIERVRIDGTWVEWHTIGGAAPVGVCGSGIVDALGQLHLAGVLTANGRIRLDAHPRVREVDGAREFVLAEAQETKVGREIAVTQGDVREILLAKAAVQTGIGVLLADGGLAASDLELVVIAGAFGSYLDVSNAVATGMLPALEPDRFRQVGNAAGTGAKLALVSGAARARARELRTRIEYLELASYPQFARRYADSCRLPAAREEAVT